jgi:hypothetical protein
MDVVGGGVACLLAPARRLAARLPVGGTHCKIAEWQVHVSTGLQAAATEWVLSSKELVLRKSKPRGDEKFIPNLL